MNYLSTLVVIFMTSGVLCAQSPLNLSPASLKAEKQEQISKQTAVLQKAENIKDAIANPGDAAKALLSKIKNPFSFKLDLLGGLSLPLDKARQGADKFYQAKGFAQGLGISMDKKRWGINLSMAKTQLKIDEQALTNWAKDKLSALGNDVLMKLRPFTRLDFHVGPTANFKLKGIRAKVGVMPGISLGSQSAVSITDKTVSLNEKLKPELTVKTIASLVVPITKRVAFRLQGDFASNVLPALNRSNNTPAGEFEKEFQENSTFNKQTTVSVGLSVLLNSCPSEKKKKSEGEDEFHLVYHKLTPEMNIGFYKVPSNFRFSFENAFTQTMYINFEVYDEMGNRISEKYNFDEQVEKAGENRYLLNLKDINLVSGKKYILKFNYLGNTLDAKIEFAENLAK